MCFGLWTLSLQCRGRETLRIAFLIVLHISKCERPKASARLASNVFGASQIFCANKIDNKHQVIWAKPETLMFTRRWFLSSFKKGVCFLSPVLHLFLSAFFSKLIHSINSLFLSPITGNHGGPMKPVWLHKMFPEHTKGLFVHLLLRSPSLGPSVHKRVGPGLWLKAGMKRCTCDIRTEIVTSFSVSLTCCVATDASAVLLGSVFIAGIDIIFLGTNPTSYVDLRSVAA